MRDGVALFLLHYLKAAAHNPRGALLIGYPVLYPVAPNPNIPPPYLN